MFFGSVPDVCFLVLLSRYRVVANHAILRGKIATA
jgi:hypothetical protein